MKIPGNIFAFATLYISLAWIPVANADDTMDMQFEAMSGLAALKGGDCVTAGRHMLAAMAIAKRLQRPDFVETLYSQYSRACAPGTSPTPSARPSPGTDPDCRPGENCYDLYGGTRPVQGQAGSTAPVQAAQSLPPEQQCAAMGAQGPGYADTPKDRMSCYFRDIGEAACKQMNGYKNWYRDRGHGANVCEIAIPGPGNQVAATKPAPTRPQEPSGLNIYWENAQGQRWRFGVDGCFVETTDRTDAYHLAVRTVGDRVYHLRKLNRDADCPKEIHDLYAQESARLDANSKPSKPFLASLDALQGNWCWTQGMTRGQNSFSGSNVQVRASAFGFGGTNTGTVSELGQRQFRIVLSNSVQTIELIDEKSFRWINSSLIANRC